MMCGMSATPGRDDDDKNPVTAPTWQQRADARQNASGKTATFPPVPAAAPPPTRPVMPPQTAPMERVEPLVRVHIEEITEPRNRPELLSSPPGKTVFDAIGPREVVATALKAMGRQYDPPWWQFWAKPKRG